MTTGAKGGVIITHNTLDTLETIKLALLSVGFDQTIEEMVAAENFYYVDPSLTTENFGGSKQGKTGTIELSLVLARPIPRGQVWRVDEVLSCLDEAGLIPEDLPALTALKGYIDGLYNEGILFVTALGESSRWQDPDGMICVPYADLSPDYNEFNLCYLETDCNAQDWFVARRK